MSNYLFHQSFSSDLAAFDADTFVDPFDAMVDDEDFGPEPGFEGMAWEQILVALAEEQDARQVWGLAS